MDRIYYAHSTTSSDKESWQILKDHLENVAKSTAGFAEDFYSGQFGYAAGILHDIGKYSQDFQRRLDGASIRVDHSTAGARESQKLYGLFHSRILEYVITGHHGGLRNYGSEESGLKERLLHSYLPDYSAYSTEISTPDLNNFKPLLTPLSNRMGFSIAFYTRMLFSCLVDADFLDTEGFCTPERSTLRGQYDSFDLLYQKFEDHMKSLHLQAKSSSINTYRREIYEQCIDKAEMPPQFFSLTVPTGGGKTLSSMAFALKHLKQHKLNRIFYIIPYTSIIEQNADVFRKIFGNENVLEHHSNYDPRPDQFEDIDLAEKKLKLSTENWNIPIVVTTNVQFFESLFSNRVSRCRKLHNLARSVIILDEAQMLPTTFLKPCLAALSELVVNYGSTVVICTATQPNLNGLLDEKNRPVEIIHSPQRLYEVFRRVNITDLGEMDDTALSDSLNSHPQVLCIVNTRKHAQRLFELLSISQGCYHLSARMCPVHRRETLKAIKDQLQKGAECRVVSTPVIEAGVDIDFPAVYRAMAGIDSVCQAAGRCNREGRRDSGDVYVFRSSETHGRATRWQQRVAEIGSMIFDEWDDPLSLPALDRYFGKLYSYEGDGLDKEKILLSFEEQLGDLSFPFEDVANVFNLIEDNTRDIIIPYDNEARSLIEKIIHAEFPWKYIRRLQGYTVNVYPEEFSELEKDDAIFSIDDRFYFLKNTEGFYSNSIGLISKKYKSNGNLLAII